jgi:hypothetical protein
MIGMPITPNIALLFWLFNDLSNGWIALDMGEETINVDIAPTLRKRKVRFGRHTLIIEEQDLMFCKCLSKLLQLIVRHLGKINIFDQGT